MVVVRGVRAVREARDLTRPRQRLAFGMLLLATCGVLVLVIVAEPLTENSTANLGYVVGQVAVLLGVVALQRWFVRPEGGAMRWVLSTIITAALWSVAVGATVALAVMALVSETTAIEQVLNLNVGAFGYELALFAGAAVFVFLVTGVQDFAPSFTASLAFAIGAAWAMTEIDKRNVEWVTYASWLVMAAWLCFAFDSRLAGRVRLYLGVRVRRFVRRIRPRWTQA